MCVCVCVCGAKNYDYLIASGVFPTLTPVTAAVLSGAHTRRDVVAVVVVVPPLPYIHTYIIYLSSRRGILEFKKRKKTDLSCTHNKPIGYYYYYVYQ